MATQTPTSNPFLAVSQIDDLYIRKNFESLNNYFNGQNQLLDFKFFEQVFTAATTGFKLAHGLSTAPLDIMVTRISGTGNVTFQYGSFDSTYMVMDASGPCRIRFFAGTYTKQKTATQTASTDAELVTASPLTAQTSFVYAGMLMYWPKATPPTGWLIYTDSPLSIASYPNLYAIFGTSYRQSGDASDTFRLPPLLGRTIVAAGSGTGLTKRSFGDKGGEETHVLTLAESPAHYHDTAPGQNDSGFFGLDNMGMGNRWGSYSYDNPCPTAYRSDTRGGDGAHNNMQPFATWYAIIKT